MPKTDASPRTCTVSGCRAKHEAKGYCHNHYVRYRKYGDPVTPAPLGGPVLYPAALTAAGVERRNADHWCRQGYLNAPVGPDGRRQWSELEVRVGVLMGRLRDLGFALPKAAEIAREVVTTGRDTWVLGAPAVAVLRVAETEADKAVTRW